MAKKTKAIIMHIGMILEAPFPPDTRIANECEVLTKARHVVHIFCLRFDDEAAYEKLAQNIFIYRLKLQQGVFNKIRVSVLRLPFYNLIWLKFLRKAALPLQLDAIHVHDIPLAAVGRALAAERGIPLVVDLHENYPAALKIWQHSRKMFGSYFLDFDRWSKYELKCVQQASRVIVVVDEAKERFEKMGVDLKKFTVVSNTLNLDHFRPPKKKPVSQLGDNFLNIIYAGGFGEHRGLRVAIEALPQILSEVPSGRLVLVGDGANRQELQRLVVKLELVDSVQFTGWVSLKELPRLIAESDVCIVPHLRSEHTETTIPHKLFQYMYLKKPVIVSDCKPLRRVIDETGAGLVHMSGDSIDFARNVLKLRDQTLRETLGQRGRQAVLSYYNWQRDGQKLVELYQALTR